MGDRHKFSGCSISGGESPGDVDHTELLSSQMICLLNSGEFSDVTFVVENVKYPVHRIILAGRCEYFRALLFGGMREAKPEVEIRIDDTTARAFEALLSYIYSGKVSLSDLSEDNVIELLGLAHKYGFLALESAISGYLKSILTTSNVCLIYDVALLYQLHDLEITCLRCMDRNAIETLNSEGFLSLSRAAIVEVIKRDSFCAPETQIFLSVKEWIKLNRSELSVEDTAAVLKYIRLPQISLHDLFHIVRPSEAFDANALLDAIQRKTESTVNEMKFRGHLIPEENIATLSHGAAVVEGDNPDNILNGDCEVFDLDRGFTRHAISEHGKHGEHGICIALGRPSIINSIRMLLWDRDPRWYSYYIEVSMDNMDWVRVIDYSKFRCRSWQNLHFEPRVVRYVRLVGVHNTVNRVFHVVHFECFYTDKVFHVQSDIVVPTENIATVDSGALVIEGVSRSRNALLNGDVKNYDWDSGYTCHQLGIGSIVIQLPQPYYISVIRLLLWDLDDRFYSYYIEVSVDNATWKVVVDKTKEDCRSWQTLSFSQELVSFIKIVGTRNTANEVFHCVHFECPASHSLSVSSSSLSPAIQEFAVEGNMHDQAQVQLPTHTQQ